MMADKIKKRIWILYEGKRIGDPTRGIQAGKQRKGIGRKYGRNRVSRKLGDKYGNKIKAAGNTTRNIQVGGGILGKNIGAADQRHPKWKQTLKMEIILGNKSRDRERRNNRRDKNPTRDTQVGK